MNRITVLGALLIAASSGFAHKVRVDFNHATQFSCYKTYSWAPAPRAPSVPGQFPSPILDQRITSYIEEALAARGLKRVNHGGDLQINYGVVVTEQPQLITYGDGFGPGWGWGAWGWGSGFATTAVVTYYEGTLVIDMMDSRRNQMVFQGTSTQSISSRPEKNNKKLAKAVNEVFEKYPPRQ